MGEAGINQIPPPSTYAQGRWVLQRRATRITETDLIDRGGFLEQVRLEVEQKDRMKAGRKSMPAKRRTWEGCTHEDAGRCGLNCISPIPPNMEKS